MLCQWHDLLQHILRFNVTIHVFFTVRCHKFSHGIITCHRVNNFESMLQFTLPIATLSRMYDVTNPISLGHTMSQITRHCATQCHKLLFVVLYDAKKYSDTQCLKLLFVLLYMMSKNIVPHYVTNVVVVLSDATISYYRSKDLFKFDG